MCGFLFSVGRRGDNLGIGEKIHRALRRRGTETEQTVNFPVGGREIDSATANDVVATLTCSLLPLRGEATPQPIKLPDGDLLAWNGEVFGGLEVDGKNDGHVLATALAGRQEDEILALFATIKGPWAFLLWQESQQRLWFGRDFFGRRSLLWKHGTTMQGSGFALSSVACQPANDKSSTGDEDSKLFLEAAWAEVPALGVYRVDCGAAARTMVASECVGDMLGWPLYLHRWQQLSNFESLAPIHSLRPFLDQPINESDDLEVSLLASLMRFNTTLPTEGDLPPMLPDTQCLDLQSGHVDQFLHLLSTAVLKRVMPVPQATSRIAVLFSGGVDSTVLALLANRHVPADAPIDLVNVAFANAQSTRTALLPHALQGVATASKQPLVSNDNQGSESEKRNYQAPDRLTGLMAVAELAQLAPERQWNFVEVNVAADTLSEWRSHVRDLMYPHNTVMDLSIASALWFAARGNGTLSVYRGSSVTYLGPYCTPARVLLLGMGADEQLAGYGRHRTSYRTNGWAGLATEVKMDLDRIAQRNLGRDDRIVGDHSREGRFPYLDEDVVSYLNQLPVWLKADMRYPRGLGEKILLRQAARQLGLQTCASLPKRAIQFGSDIAKMDNRKEKGRDTL